MAMMPKAPGLFSITTAWPRIVRSCSPTMRITMSVALPGPNGTITFTGLDGYFSCACAAPRTHKTASTIKPRRFMFPPVVVLRCSRPCRLSSRRARAHSAPPHPVIVESGSGCRCCRGSGLGQTRRHAGAGSPALDQRGATWAARGSRYEPGGELHPVARQDRGERDPDQARAEAVAGAAARPAAEDRILEWRRVDAGPALRPEAVRVGVETGHAIGEKGAENEARPLGHGATGNRRVVLGGAHLQRDGWKNAHRLLDDGIEPRKVHDRGHRRRSAAKCLVQLVMQPAGRLRMLGEEKQCP